MLFSLVTDILCDNLPFQHALNFETAHCFITQLLLEMLTITRMTVSRKVYLLQGAITGYENDNKKKKFFF